MTSEYVPLLRALYGIDDRHCDILQWRGQTGKVPNLGTNRGCCFEHLHEPTDLAA